MGHGSMYHRRPGSMGPTSTPGRVFKGKKLPGQMGHVTRTIQNLEVVAVDPENNLLLIKGSVPGPKKGLVVVKTAIKKVEVAVVNKDKETAVNALGAATAIINKAASKGVYHKNNAARKVSRLAKAVNSLN